MDWFWIGKAICYTVMFASWTAFVFIWGRAWEYSSPKRGDRRD